MVPSDHTLTHAYIRDGEQRQESPHASACWLKRASAYGFFEGKIYAHVNVPSHFLYGASDVNQALCMSGNTEFLGLNSPNQSLTLGPILPELPPPFPKTSAAVMGTPPY